jgi:hypothetical protein
MLKRVVLGFTLVIFSGCASTADEALMNMRRQALENSDLYRAAAKAYADSADQIASQKHQFQEMILAERDKAWREANTVNGVIQVSPEELADMLKRRDEAYKKLAESRAVWSRVSNDYRKMVDDKYAFDQMVYSQEVDAQKAKESLKGALNSALHFMLGVGATAAPLIPLAF